VPLRVPKGGEIKEYSWKILYYGVKYYSVEELYPLEYKAV
jgi:hypothetical protein